MTEPLSALPAMARSIGVTPLPADAPLPDPFATAQPPTETSPVEQRLAGRELLDRSAGERLLERALATDVPFRPLLKRLDALTLPPPTAVSDPRLDALAQQQAGLLAAQREIAAYTTQTSLWLAGTQLMLATVSKLTQGLNALLKQQ